MTYGVTAEGFVIKPLSVSLTEIQAEIIALFGNGVTFAPQTEFGKLSGIMARREFSLWELAEIVFNNHYPDSASGIPLGWAVRLTGIERKAATRSTVAAYLIGTAATPIPAATLFGVDGNQTQFRTIAPAVLIGSPLAITSITRASSTATVTTTASHGLSAGAVIYVAGADQDEYNGFFVALTATGSTITYTVDGTPATPATGTITYQVPTEVECEGSVTGPLEAAAFTLTRIVNPISGLTAVSNVEDASIGTNEETDAELLERWESSRAVAGKATVNAIRAALLRLASVTAASVIENVSDSPDGDGRSGHSFESVVDGGVNQTIANEIFGVKAAGIETVGLGSGAESETVVDSEGESHTIEFSRPDEVEIWVTVDNLTTDGDYPLDGDAQIVAAILAYGAARSVGDDVIVFPYLSGALASIPGITDYDLLVGLSDPPTLSNNIIIAKNARAVFDAARIVVQP